MLAHGSVITFFYKVAVAVDIDMEVLIKFEHAFEDARLLLYSRC